MKPIRIALALSTLAFAALGSAQVSKSGDGSTLRMKFTKGQKISYETTTTVASGCGSAGYDEVGSTVTFYGG